MSCKQWSWRRSNKALIVTLLLSIPNYSLSMDYSDYQMWQRLSQDPSTLPAIEPPPVLVESAINSYESDPSGPEVEQRPEESLWAPSITDDQKAHYSFEGTTWQEMEAIFPDAPLKAQVLVDHLKKNINPKVRASCFIGPQGSGKTTTAIAIAHFANWHIHFIAAGDLMANYRNKTKELLLKELKFAALASQRKKMLVILDEMNELFEHADNENYDSSATAKAFWQFLDRQKQNMNLFLICTMNRITKLPRPLKQRMEQSLNYFEAKSSRRALRNTFRKQVALNPHIKLDSSVNDACINRCIAELKKREVPITGRDFENILDGASFLCYAEDPENNDRKIKPKHLEESAKLIVNSDDPNYVEEKKSKTNLTEEEKREFALMQNRITEIRLQCSNKTPMGLSFTAGFSPSVTGNVARSPGLDLDQAIKIIEEEFTPEQKALYRRVKGLRDDASLIERGALDNIEQSMRNIKTSFFQGLCKRIGISDITRARYIEPEEEISSEEENDNSTNVSRNN